jgi:phosphoribosyl 1,2-cyclic phosphate phosphodiesterase
MELVILGTSAGAGVPLFHCGCKACQEAIGEQRYHRTRCAIALLGDENILIDAPPELAVQLSRNRITEINYFALTHWHYDHFGGLGELEIYVRLHRLNALPALMTHETWTQLEVSFGYMADCLDTKLLEAGQTVKAGEVHLTALEASHAPGTIGFLIESKGKRLAYLPDTGQLPDDTRKRLRGIEYLLLDTTFWGQNRLPYQHLSFNEAIAVGQELEVAQLYLTHLAMHHDTPVTNRELEEAIKPYGGRVRLAYDGLRLAL